MIPYSKAEKISHLERYKPDNITESLAIIMQCISNFSLAKSAGKMISMDDVCDLKNLAMQYDRAGLDRMWDRIDHTAENSLCEAALYTLAIIGTLEFPFGKTLGQVDVMPPLADTLNPTVVAMEILCSVHKAYSSHKERNSRGLEYAITLLIAQIERVAELFRIRLNWIIDARLVKEGMR